MAKITESASRTSPHRREYWSYQNHTGGFPDVSQQSTRHTHPHHTDYIFTTHNGTNITRYPEGQKLPVAYDKTIQKLEHEKAIDWDNDLPLTLFSPINGTDQALNEKEKGAPPYVVTWWRPDATRIHNPYNLRRRTKRRLDSWLPLPEPTSGQWNILTLRKPISMSRTNMANPYKLRICPIVQANTFPAKK